MWPRLHAIATGDAAVALVRCRFGALPRQRVLRHRGTRGESSRDAGGWLLLLLLFLLLLLLLFF